MDQGPEQRHAFQLPNTEHAQQVAAAVGELFARGWEGTVAAPLFEHFQDDEVSRRMHVRT